MNNYLMQRVVLSPQLNMQSINVYRSSGSFIAGRWVEDIHSPPYFPVPGVCYPSTDKDLQMFPEGDRPTAAITFYTVEKLYATHGGQNPGLSDKIEWDGEMYKILTVAPWQDYGFHKSIATRMLGE